MYLNSLQESRALGWSLLLVTLLTHGLTENCIGTRKHLLQACEMGLPCNAVLWNSRNKSTGSVVFCWTKSRKTECLKHQNCCQSPGTGCRKKKRQNKQPAKTQVGFGILRITERLSIAGTDSSRHQCWPDFLSSFFIELTPGRETLEKGYWVYLFT